MSTYVSWIGKGIKMPVFKYNTVVNTSKGKGRILARGRAGYYWVSFSKKDFSNEVWVAEFTPKNGPSISFEFKEEDIKLIE